jgi:catechol 2,3-dioxygenase-like lactoylglutathione lyase family enzyme
MEKVISNLLKDYEHGALTRRELIQGLVILGAATATASAAGFQASSIDHVSVVANDVERSADFYQRAFGLSILNKDPADESIRLKVGSSYLALRRRKDPGRVDHFALGVADFNKTTITRDLIHRGVVPEKDEEGDAGFHVKDPDGFRVQIISNDPRFNEGYKVG